MIFNLFMVLFAMSFLTYKAIDLDNGLKTFSVTLWFAVGVLNLILLIGVI